MSEKKNDLIVQSNDLIEAYYDTDLTANEHKIIRYVASKIKLKDNSFPDYSFEVREFANAAGVKGNNYHSQIERIADEITKKRIKIKSKSKDKEKIGWFPWFSGVVYERGVVHISFNPLIKHFLLSLEDSFTKYPFQVISPLRSGYSIRLFELLKQYEKIGQRTIELEELRHMLGLGNKYPEYPNLKQRVLKHAQTELKEKTLLSFEFEEIRQSRKVVSIKFIINSKYKTKQLTLFDENGEDPLDLPVDSEDVNSIKTLFKTESLSLNSDTVSKWLQDYGKQLIYIAFDEVKNRKNKRTIHHPAKYVGAILESIKMKLSDPTDDKGSNEVSVYNVIDTIVASFSNSSEMIPDFIIKDRSISEFEDLMNISLEEAEKIWESYREDIINNVHSLIKIRSKIKR